DLKSIKIYNSYIKDSEENIYEVENAFVDLKVGKLSGKNIIINLNNKSFNPENEPKLKGEKIFFKDNITSISNGLFTTCKQRDGCPPWELSASEITHDRNKKTINYKNVWLN